MNGKIKFYNEEKKFGVIIGKDKDEYFFFVDKVINAPEKIYKNDKVKFDGFSTKKGLNAKNITFEVKVKCHVCNWINTEDAKNCSNPKCGFTLRYAKGIYTDISTKETEQYKKDLHSAKALYQEDNKPKKIKSNKQIEEKIITLTPEILEKDMFETTEQYQDRIKNLGYVKIGIVNLINYDADKRELKFNLNIKGNIRYKFDTSIDLRYDKHTYTIIINPSDAQNLYLSKNPIVTAKIDMRESNISILDIKVDKYSFYNELEKLIEENEQRKNRLKEYKDKIEEAIKSIPSIVIDKNTNLEWKVYTSESYAMQSSIFPGFLEGGWRVPTKGLLKNFIENMRHGTIEEQAVVILWERQHASFWIAERDGAGCHTYDIKSGRICRHSWQTNPNRWHMERILHFRNRVKPLQKKEKSFFSKLWS